MLAISLDKKEGSDPSIVLDVADSKIVSSIRLLLAISVLSAVFIYPASGIYTHSFTWLVFFGFFLHSLVIYIYSQLNQPFSHSKLSHWLDVFWCLLMVFCTGGINSFFFLLFFFPILTSSFRWGFEEGAMVTVASAALFVAFGLGLGAEDHLSNLLLRTTFLLAFGYMCAYWGAAKVGLTRRLALLRDVSHLSNPRFGVDHTITTVLEKTRLYFKGNSCILVIRDKE